MSGEGYELEFKKLEAENAELKRQLAAAREDARGMSGHISELRAILGDLIDHLGKAGECWE